MIVVRCVDAEFACGRPLSQRVGSRVTMWGVLLYVSEFERMAERRTDCRINIYYDGGGDV